MSAPAILTVHPSQFPQQVRRELLNSLRSRQVNHKFHYDSVTQTQKWLALHQAYSPSRTDPGCAAIYDAGFLAATRQSLADSVHLVGLGCGGGQKDTRLLKLILDAGKDAFYTPSDVSTAMVLVAREASLAVIPAGKCFPLVCDLALADDLARVLDAQPHAGTTRLVTFFGMIPNFEPESVMPRIAGILRRNDLLLLSANLAPGPDYTAGVNRILPLYDNDLTRDWLLTFLRDLGVDIAAGELRFLVEENPAAANLKRVAAFFRFGLRSVIEVDSERFQFDPGDSIRLFFSYRHTLDTVKALLHTSGLAVRDYWITTSEEEGVFLCSRQ